MVLISYLITICTAPGAVRRYSDLGSTTLVSQSFRVREIICFLSCQSDIREFIACWSGVTFFLSDISHSSLLTLVYSLFWSFGFHALTLECSESSSGLSKVPRLCCNLSPAGGVRIISKLALVKKKCLRCCSTWLEFLAEHQVCVEISCAIMGGILQASRQLPRAS